jgi:hypothetical protein
VTAKGSFAHKIDLDEGVGNTVLLWSAAEVPNGGPLQVKMIHRGYVGWMALGLAHPGGNHKGMNGGQVVMGMSWDDDTLSVDEYRITEQCSSFRCWKDPLSQTNPENVSLDSASFTVQNGVSTLEFNIQSAIYMKELNLTSSNMRNAFIWGLTYKDYCTHDYGGYCSHHDLVPKDRSRRSEVRGVLWLDLASGETEEYEPEPEEEEDGTSEPHPTATSSSRKPQGSALVWTAAVLVIVSWGLQGPPDDLRRRP